MRISLNMFSAMVGCATLVIAAGCSSNQSQTVAPVPTLHVQLNTTTDLNAYRASIPGPRQSGHTRSRLGKGCGNCWTNVTISAYSWANNFGGAHFPANPGDMYPIGHIVNTGAVETDLYSLKPSTVAEYDIYITNDAGEAAWQIIEVPNGPSGQLTIKSKGKLRACPGHGKKPKSEADFRNCDYGASAKDPLRLAGASGLERLIARLLSKSTASMFTVEDPGWISCTEGCCTLTMN